MPFPSYLITTKPQPLRSFLQPARSTMLVNYDEINTIYIDDSASVSSSSQPIPPLGWLIVDGKGDLYAVSSSGSPGVRLYLIPGGQGFGFSPAQVKQQLLELGLALDSSVNAPTYGPAKDVSIGALHAPGKTIAGEVAATGAPLIVLHNNILQKNGTLAGGGSVTYTSAAFTQPGYAAEFVLTQAIGSPTIPWVRVQLQWIDQTSGILVWEDDFILAIGANGGGNQYIGRGPTKGNQVQVKITNLEPSLGVTYALNIWQDSHVEDRHDWKQDYSGFAFSSPLFSLPNVGQNNNFLAFSAPSINANSSVTRLLPLYVGVVDILFITPAGLTGSFTISAPTGTISAAGQAITASLSLAAATTQQYTGTLPRMNMILTLTNNGASAGVFTIYITAREQQP